MDTIDWVIVIILAVLFMSLMSVCVYDCFIDTSPEPVEEVGMYRQVPTLLESELSKSVIPSRYQVESKQYPPKVVDKNTGIPKDLLVKISACADAYKIPLPLLLALIEVESNFDERAVSKYNGDGSSDYGLMQLNERTFPDYSRDELMGVDINLKLGCEYLRGLYDKYGCWGYAVYRYNGGVRHVCRVVNTMVGD